MAPGGAQPDETPGNERPQKKANRRALFVAEYLIDLNGRKAAIRAGFAEKSAHVTASRLLKDPWVKAEVRRELADRRKRLRVSADKVEQELAKIGFANLLDYLEPDGSINLRKINRDLAAAILEVKVDKIEMAGPDNPEDPSSPAGEPVPHEPGEVEGAEPASPVQAAPSTSARLEPQAHGGALKRTAAAKATIITTKLKLHPKVAALELLGKRLKMFTDKVEHEGKISVVVDL